MPYLYPGLSDWEFFKKAILEQAQELVDEGQEEGNRVPIFEIFEVSYLPSLNMVVLSQENVGFIPLYEEQEDGTWKRPDNSDLQLSLWWDKHCAWVKGRSDVLQEKELPSRYDLLNP